ncbi:MAG: hypothetical protein AB4290_09080, partial [Spirulina sp.]
MTAINFSILSLVPLKNPLSRAFLTKESSSLDRGLPLQRAVYNRVNFSSEVSSGFLFLASFERLT